MDDDDDGPNPFECPLCFEFYDGDGHIPTTFPCGHRLVVFS